jgi:TolB-like protein
MLYEMLTGVHPFRTGTQAETINSILSEHPSAISRYTEDTSDILEHTVEKMLAKNPADRYQSVHEVGTNLNKLFERLSVPGVTPIAVEPRTRPWLLAGAALAMLVALALVIHFFQPSPVDSIAIPPFVNVAADENSASLCVGIPDAISSRLARLQQLRIKPTSVLRRYEGMDINLQQVSEEQGVRAVLIGRLEHRDNTLVVSVNLIDGRDNTLIIGIPRFSREYSDILAVEEEIARKIAQELLPELTSEETESLAQSGTQNPEAHQDFMLGQHHFLSRVDLKTAITHYESAVSKDPSYQEAYWQLSKAYFVIAREQTGDYSKSREYAEKVVAIDSSTDIAHETNASMLWQWERDWKGAEREYEKVTALDSRASLGFLSWMGRREEFEAEIEKQVEQSDPLSALQQRWLGWQFLYHGDYDRAIEQANKSLTVNPQSGGAYYILGASYLQKGMEKEALEATLQYVRLSDGNEERIAELQKAFEESGWESVKRLLLGPEPSEWSKPISAAMHFAGLGDKDRAFEWLEKAWSWDLPLWGLENAPANPEFDSLRDDPRFEELLRKQNLPEDVIQRHLAMPRG